MEATGSIDDGRDLGLRELEPEEALVPGRSARERRVEVAPVGKPEVVAHLFACATGGVRAKCTTRTQRERTRYPIISSLQVCARLSLIETRKEPRLKGKETGRVSFFLKRERGGSSRALAPLA